jgi:hypothetical protein
MCRCALTELSFNSTCTTCPPAGVCDGSSKLQCDQGSYKTDDGQGGVPSCQSCPVGGNCSNNVFTPTVEGSTWRFELDNTAGVQVRLARVLSCPPGFSLVRSRYNSLGDTCDRCTKEFYNMNGSVWYGKDSLSGDFCLRCPISGAICPVLLYSPFPPTPFLGVSFISYLV